jgi:serine/threonine-protein kinase
MPIGTPTYMAPEQAAGAPTDHRADLYAFGIVMYECILGRPPFQGKTVVDLLAKHMNEPPPPLAPLVAIDSELDALIKQLLEKSPDDRPKDMGVVKGELQRLKTIAIEENRALYGPKGGNLALFGGRMRGRGSRALLFVVGGLATAAIAVGGVMIARKPPPAVVVAPPPVAPRPEPPKAAPMGRLVVTSTAPSMRIFLDKSATEKSVASVAAGGGFLKVPVPADTDFVMRIEAEGYKTYTMPVRVSAGDENAMPVAMEKLEASKPAPPPRSGGRPTSKPPTAAKATAAAPGDKKPTNPNMLDPF